jgi:hypothetical protein
LPKALHWPEQQPKLGPDPWLQATGFPFGEQHTWFPFGPHVALVALGQFWPPSLHWYCVEQMNGPHTDPLVEAQIP